MSYDERVIIRQLAGFIATALGEGWKVDTSEEYNEHIGTHVNGPDDARLYVYPEGVTRVAVSCSWPVWTVGIEMTKVKPITLRRDRGSKVIAQEITRRLLPPYRDQLTRARGAAQVAQLDAVAREAAATALVAALPGARLGLEHTRLYMYGEPVSGELRLSADGSEVINLELRYLSLETVLKIAAVLREV